MLDISIKTIPHGSQRYPTVGDYWVDAATGRLEIRVSDMGNWRYEALVAFHELAEYLKVTHDNIPIDEIDAFDIEYERQRPLGDFSEPGNDKRAPYRDAHRMASLLESMLAHELDVDWQAYNKVVEEL